MVGDFDGCLDGFWEAVTDGLFDGTWEDVVVGEIVGETDGLAEVRIEGVSDGKWDGDWVGFALGKDVVIFTTVHCWIFSQSSIKAVFENCDSLIPVFGP